MLQASQVANDSMGRAAHPPRYDRRAGTAGPHHTLWRWNQWGFAMEELSESLTLVEIWRIRKYHFPDGESREKYETRKLEPLGGSACGAETTCPRIDDFRACYIGLDIHVPSISQE